MTRMVSYSPVDKFKKKVKEVKENIKRRLKAEQCRIRKEALEGIEFDALPEGAAAELPAALPFEENIEGETFVPKQLALPCLWEQDAGKSFEEALGDMGFENLPEGVFAELSASFSLDSRIGKEKLTRFQIASLSLMEKDSEKNGFEIEIASTDKSPIIRVSLTPCETFEQMIYSEFEEQHQALPLPSEGFAEFADFDSKVENRMALPPPSEDFTTLSEFLKEEPASGKIPVKGKGCD